MMNVCVLLSDYCVYTLVDTIKFDLSKVYKIKKKKEKENFTVMNI